MKKIVKRRKEVREIQKGKFLTGVTFGGVVYVSVSKETKTVVIVKGPLGLKVHL